MSAQMMYMPRDFVLISKFGHAVNFVANEHVRVPYPVIDEAIAIGAVFANKEDQKILVDEPKEVVTPDLGFEREQKLYDAMHQIAKENDPDQFTPGGKPKLSVLVELLGYDIDRKEANDVWVKVMQSIANAS
jgi:hypothetical protein